MGYRNLEMQPSINGNKFPIFEGAYPNEIMMGYEFEIDPSRGSYEPLFVTDHAKRVAVPNPKLKHPFTEVPKGFTVVTESFAGHYGYEFKSPVAPLRIHKLQVPAFFARVEANNKVSGRDTNWGGIHVNVSKDSFTNRLHNLVFDFMHDRANFDKFFKLSERSVDSFGAYCPQIMQGRFDHNKMGIITLQKRYAYEIRMFHSKDRLLLPALEFADAVFNAADETTGALTWAFFEEYVRSHLRYRHLSELIDTNINVKKN